MKIGFFYPEYFPVSASASIHGYQIAKGLVRKGHTLLSCINDNNPNCIKYPDTKFGTFKLVRDADVLYVRSAPYFEHVSIWKLARPFSLPVVWEINAPIEERYAFRSGADIDGEIKVLNRKRKFYAQFVDASVCVSKVIRDYSRQCLKIGESYYVPNGSDSSHFSPQTVPDKSLEHLKGKFKIMWAGNPRLPWQATDLMLDICNRLEPLNKDIFFVFICSEKTKRSFPNLRNMLVLNTINYLDMPRYLAAADVCLCFYNSYDWCKYGFYNSPLKLFDYMAAGKAVLASNMGQLKEVIKDGINGFLFDNDVDSIVRAILFLYRERELLQKIGERARNDIIMYYNWGRVVDQLEKILLAEVSKKNRKFER